MIEFFAMLAALIVLVCIVAWTVTVFDLIIGIFAGFTVLLICLYSL